MKTATENQLVNIAMTFNAGEAVAFVDANNRLRFGVVIMHDDAFIINGDARIEGRVSIRDREGNIVRPNADRVAHL